MILPRYERGEGPVVVLVHGRASNHQTWEPTLPYLEGYRVVMVDLPGHGDAPAPEEAAAYALDAQRASLEETLADLRRPFAMVGHSMGGFVALRFALENPGRLSALVLAATAAASPYRGGRNAKAREVVLEQARIAHEEGMDALCAYLEAREMLYPTQRERLMKMKPHAYHGVVHGNVEMEDLDPRLPSLRVPTMVVCGLDDAIFEPECRRLHERIPGARGVFLQGAGHSPHREAAPEFGAALVDFLGEYAGAPGRAGAAS